MDSQVARPAVIASLVMSDVEMDIVREALDLPLHDHPIVVDENHIDIRCSPQQRVISQQGTMQVRGEQVAIGAYPLSDGIAGYLM
jgi:hypothetical protein